jgi:hypothetical protein
MLEGVVLHHVVVVVHSACYGLVKVDGSRQFERRGSLRLFQL